MRKRWFSSVVFLLTFTAAAGAVNVLEEPIYRYGTPVAVSVATNTYTNVTSQSAAAGVRLSMRTAVLLDNPSTNSSIIHGHVGNCTSTAISTTTVKGPIEVAPSANGAIIPVGNDACLWLVSRNGDSGGAESVTIQDVSQRNGP